MAKNSARQGGQIVVLTAICLPLLIALAGVIADGGRLLVEYRRAQVAIDAAAFAAAQVVDVHTFLESQAVVPHYTGGAQFGGLYGGLNSRGRVHVTSIAIENGQVVARGYTDVDTFFLKMFGVGPVHLTLTSRGVPAYGIYRETQ